jgi:hypothetical protein
MFTICPHSISNRWPICFGPVQIGADREPNFGFKVLLSVSGGSHFGAETHSEYDRGKSAWSSLGGCWNWVGAISELLNRRDSRVDAPERRPRHDGTYYEGGWLSLRRPCFSKIGLTRMRMGSALAFAEKSKRCWSRSFPARFRVHVMDGARRTGRRR